MGKTRLAPPHVWPLASGALCTCGARRPWHPPRPGWCGGDRRRHCCRRLALPTGAGDGRGREAAHPGGPLAVVGARRPMARRASASGGDAVGVGVALTSKGWEFPIAHSPAPIRRRRPGGGWPVCTYFSSGRSPTPIDREPTETINGTIPSCAAHTVCLLWPVKRLGAGGAPPPLRVGATAGGRDRTHAPVLACSPESASSSV